MRAVLLKGQTNCCLGMALCFCVQSVACLLWNLDRGIDMARTADQLFHRFLIKRCTVIIKSGKQQVLFALIRFDLQAGQDKVTGLAAQTFNDMQTRAMLRNIERDVGHGSGQSFAALNDALAQRM